MMQFLFCIFNSLQGFFIFLFLVVREKPIRKAVAKCFHCTEKPTNNRTALPGAQNVDNQQVFETWKSKLSARVPTTWLARTTASKVTEPRQATMRNHSDSYDSNMSTDTPVINADPNRGKLDSTSTDSTTSVELERIDDIEYMIHSPATAKKETDVQRTASCEQTGVTGRWSVDHVWVSSENSSLVNDVLDAHTLASRSPFISNVLERHLVTFIRGTMFLTWILSASNCYFVILDYDVDQESWSMVDGLASGVLYEYLKLPC